MKKFIFVTYEKEGVCRMKIVDVYRGVGSHVHDDVDPNNGHCIMSKKFAESIIYQICNLKPHEYELEHKTQKQINRTGF